MYLVAGVTAFFSPIAGSLAFVGFLAGADFITGIIKARKAGNITSKRMIDKVYSSLGYFIAITIAHVVETHIGNDIVPMVKAVIAVIGVTELQSLRENIKEITGVDLLNTVTTVVKKKS
jgi:phage-related holin